MPRGRSKKSTRIKLQKAMEDQKRLENELKLLQKADDQKDSATDIINFVKNGALNDPLLDQENPFKINHNPGCFGC